MLGLHPTYNHKKINEYRKGIRLFLAEMVGFEPTHRLLGLPHFECGLLSHLSTSPKLPKQYNTDYEESQVCGIIIRPMK